MHRAIIDQVNHAIIGNDDFEEQTFYGVFMGDALCRNLPQYFAQFKVTDPADQISLAQHWGRTDLAGEIYGQVVPTLAPQQKATYRALAENNEGIHQTLCLDLLDPKYAFLGQNLEYFSTDRWVQELLLSLDDPSLQLFQALHQKICASTQNPLPYLCRVLGAIGEPLNRRDCVLTDYQGANLPSQAANFRALAQSLHGELSASELNNLLYALANNQRVVPVTKASDLAHVVPEAPTPAAGDLDGLKNAVLMRAYGCDLAYAQYLTKCFDLTGITPRPQDKAAVQTFQNIKKIARARDPQPLADLLPKLPASQPDLNALLWLEDGLRATVNAALNREFWQPTAQTPCTTDQGVKIYDAGTDFKICLTAVGAYSNQPADQNYAAHWHKKSLRSHGNCCSLVANDNLSTAQINSICLGFTNFPDGALLGANSFDINSTLEARNLNLADGLLGRSCFQSAQSLVDRTRSDYNELVFERRDLDPHAKTYKKGPSYLVYFEEFCSDTNPASMGADAEAILSDQKHHYAETLRAAQEFNLPIVKINREACARSELAKIKQQIAAFQKAPDPALLARIIIGYENNRTGLRPQPHHALQERYFSAAQMQTIIATLRSSIAACPDPDLQARCTHALEQTIDREREAYTLLAGGQYLHFGQTSSFANTQERTR